MQKSILSLIKHALNAPAGEALDAAEALHTHLQAAPIGIIRPLNRTLRQRSAPTLRCDDIERLGEGAAQDTLMGLATLQRSGRERQAATCALVTAQGRLTLGFLLWRLNDPFADIRADAEAILIRRLPEWPVDDVRDCLPLILALAELRHAAESPVRAVLAERLSDPTDVLPALSSPDPLLRRAALTWNAALCRGDAAIAETLEVALSDRHPAIRTHAATLALDSNVTPSAVCAPLLPDLERDRSPHIRRLALRARIRQGQAEEALVAAALDASAGVRFLARRHLQRRGIAVDYDARIAAILADPDAGRDAVVAALGTLSDVGGADDIEAVRRFLDDRRAAVRREAARTLAILGG